MIYVPKTSVSVVVVVRVSAEDTVVVVRVDATDASVVDSSSVGISGGLGISAPLAEKPEEIAI